MYMGLEILWRGYTHWTMGIAGGICGVIVGYFNEFCPNTVKSVGTNVFPAPRRAPERTSIGTYTIKTGAMVRRIFIPISITLSSDVKSIKPYLPNLI